MISTGEIQRQRDIVRFFGFKLHLNFHDRDELFSLLLTQCNGADRKPVISPCCANVQFRKPSLTNIR
jgi:hypothetical protein